MTTVFLDTLKMLIRDRSIFVWALAFPLILSTMFMFMFSGLDEAQSFDPVPTAVVQTDEWKSSSFADIIDEMAKEGQDQLLDIHSFATESAARDALFAGDVYGILNVDAQGSPTLVITPTSDTVGIVQISHTILQTLVSSYTRSTDLVEELAKQQPQVLMQAVATGRVQEAFTQTSFTQKVSLTHSAPSESVRFYYALFGMAALFGAQVGMIAIGRMQPNLSALGARRAVGALSRGRTLLMTLVASWVVSLGCLLVAFAYVRFIVGVDFGGRDGLAIAGLAVASFCATALGALLGSIPKLNISAKAGILTGIACFLSLFAGLYGEPCMELADMVSREAPVFAMLNPAKVITDLFYSLYFYDALDPYLSKVLVLLAMAAVFLGVSSIFVRRQRYASI